MTTYRLTFTPTEPYFFGNEKTFRFADAKIAGQFDNPYFIRSELIPAQTTLFGAVRYLLLNDRIPAFTAYPENYKDRIGESSFRLDASEKQSFGIIHNISPLFLQYRKTESADTSLPEEGIYVRTPLDHLEGQNAYTPFRRAPLTEEGKEPKREFAENYDVKKGLTDSYMHISSGKIVESSEIFRSVTRIGISKKQSEDAFFKKEYRMLNDGWSFGIYLTLNQPEGENLSVDSVVFLGQNKAAFRVEYQQEENQIKEQVSTLLKPNTVYCLGDTFAGSSIYPNFTFAAVLTRDHRTYETRLDSRTGKVRIGKGSTLYKLIRAGSVFWYDQASLNTDKINRLFANPNASTIGMNQIIIKE